MSAPVEFDSAEAKEIDGRAKAAGLLARNKRATELMPFAHLDHEQRQLATWLKTLGHDRPKDPKKNLTAFHSEYNLDQRETPHPMSPIQVLVGQTNSPLGMIDRHKVKTVDGLLAEVATVFARSSSTNDIHEISSLFWRLKCGDMGNGKMIEFVHQPSTRARVKASLRIPDVSEYTRRWHRNDQVAVNDPDADFVVASLRLLGHEHDLDAAETDAYKGEKAKVEEEIRKRPAHARRVEKEAEKAKKREEKESGGEKKGLFGRKK